MTRRRTAKRSPHGNSRDPNFKRWTEFARQGQYWKLTKDGKFTCKILAEPVYAERQFGNRTSEGVDIPTDKGTLSTGSKGFLSALAEYDETRSIVGRTVTFQVEGAGTKERTLTVISIR